MAQFYVWQKYDCFCEVAKKFNITCEKLARINGITNIDVLMPGDIIRVK